MATEAKEMEIPTEFDPNQMFVAVSDRGGEVAGEDGGPKYGGIGMWYVGQVGRWTSTNAVPLALRDPNTGLIWKGYLEPVVRTRIENGRHVCDKGDSTPYFAPNPGASVKKPMKRITKGAAPSASAVSRAVNGPGKLTPLVRPVGPARAAAHKAGLSTSE